VKTSPRVVEEDEWRTAYQALLAKEKALTHARDELATERRRLPMVRVKNYSFEGTGGPVTLLELFDGRSQLLLRQREQNLYISPAWASGKHSESVAFSEGISVSERSANLS
jgi:predicted dithiol-disulfide oxidoreductase (DUF899 family)